MDWRLDANAHTGERAIFNPGRRLARKPILVQPRHFAPCENGHPRFWLTTTHARYYRQEIEGLHRPNSVICMHFALHLRACLKIVSGILLTGALLHYRGHAMRVS